MPVPFLALAPFQPRIVDIYYAAAVPTCVDCTDCSDVSDYTTDQSDQTDGGGEEVII